MKTNTKNQIWFYTFKKFDAELFENIPFDLEDFLIFKKLRNEIGQKLPKFWLLYFKF